MLVFVLLAVITHFLVANTHARNTEFVPDFIDNRLVIMVMISAVVVCNYQTSGVCCGPKELSAVEPPVFR